MAGFRVLALGALLLFLLSGCMGGSSDDEPLETAQPGPASPVVEQSPTAQAASTPTVTQTADIVASAQAANCEITSPSEQGPSGWGGNPATYPLWYQESDTWIAPNSASGLNSALPSDSGGWYAGDSFVTILPASAGDTVEITGQAIGGQSDAAAFEVRSESPTFGVVGILTIPVPGCWELEISTGQQTFPLTIYALPMEARPDVIWASGMRESVQTNLYPVPASCAVTEPTLADEDRGVALYWFYGTGIKAVMNPPAIFWAGEEMLMLWYPEMPGALEVSGQFQDDPSVTLRSSLMQQTGASGERWSSTLVFPAPGCWELEGSTSDGTLEATIYVYPLECQHEAGESLPESCQPPET